MFGETAWGDQYAYRRGASGDLGQEVYFLEGALLRPQVIAGSFDEFMMNEFLRNARDPYDPLTIEAVQCQGLIDLSNHWVYESYAKPGGGGSGLPFPSGRPPGAASRRRQGRLPLDGKGHLPLQRSEERRVGKECLE